MSWGVPEDFLRGVGLLTPARRSLNAACESGEDREAYRGA
jgi:hypothetical protein